MPHEIKRRKPEIDEVASKLRPEDKRHFVNFASDHGWYDDWVVDGVHTSNRGWANAIAKGELPTGRNRSKK